LESFSNKALTGFLRKNPNDFTNEKVDWAANLEGQNKRFQPYNGGVSEKQLQWLEMTLKSAEELGVH
jgi:hypothetical protein